MLAIAVAHFASTWNLYVLLSWLPSYFRDVQHLTLTNAGLFSAGPWISSFVGTHVAASVADRLIARGVTNCGFAPGLIDVAPRHAALLYGVSNTFATLPGIIGVTVTGWLVDRTGTYTAGFVLAAGVSITAALLFGLLFEARPLEDEAAAGT